jgi:hypothetical protein
LPFLDLVSQRYNLVAINAKMAKMATKLYLWLTQISDAMLSD